MSNNMSFTRGPWQPTKHTAIVPNNSTNLPTVPKAIYCQAAGNIVVRDKSGTDLTYAMTTGQVLHVRAVRVLATGTTGTYYAWN
ncbi:spike base protein, RCAP_Rcc01079 family [Pararhizobium gei]|uniref:spike base protein, RCAP_Rcc01079 family n=1 Tax=Pararhizobium gei TaxID=1395951 RepID=UPI0023DA44D9|nr:hypothetical protein [Rhizobium gei]